MIVEFASHGNLKQYLQKKRRTGGGSEVTQVENPLDEKDLISFSFQVARGMEYLASQKVHVTGKYLDYKQHSDFTIWLYVLVG